jgi:hypothetical protein
MVAYCIFWTFGCSQFRRKLKKIIPCCTLKLLSSMQIVGSMFQGKKSVLYSGMAFIFVNHIKQFTVNFCTTLGKEKEFYVLQYLLIE